MEFSKLDVLLANEHQSDQKKRLQMIFVKKFRSVFVHAKTTLSVE